MKTNINVCAVILFLSIVFVAPALFADPPDWSVNPPDYNYDGSITAAVYMDTVQVGASGDLLGAFVGTECHGVQDAWQTPIQTYIFPTKVYSNHASGETLSFKYYDSVADIVYDIEETIEFVADMIVGSMIDPYPMHIVVMNHPPNQPSNLGPPNGASDVSVDTALCWSGGDPDSSDTVMYFVCFGTDPNPALYDSIGPYPATTSPLCYDLPLLEYDTTYYWKVVAEDNHGSSTIGDIWNFTTTAGVNNPPNGPSNPAPHGITGVSINTPLFWTGGDPDAGDDVTYYIYFGTSPEPALYDSAGPYPDTTTDIAYYDLEQLDYCTMYFWKIMAQDNHGATTEGLNWSFTTVCTTSSWWDSSWTYRKELTVSDHCPGRQMLLKVYKEDGYDSSVDGVIDCEGHCNVDFSDIRFVAEDHTTTLSYWIEEIRSDNGDDYALVWVKTPGADNIYIYYGNPGATTDSDGDNTFIYFDHWTEDNTGDWTYAHAWLNNHYWWLDTQEFNEYRELQMKSTLFQWYAGADDHTTFGWTEDKVSQYFNVDHVLIYWDHKKANGATDSLISVKLHLKKGDSTYTTDLQNFPKPSSSDNISVSLKYCSAMVSYEMKNADSEIVLASDYIDVPSKIPQLSDSRYLLHHAFDFDGGRHTWYPPTCLIWGNRSSDDRRRGMIWLTDYWFVRKCCSPEPQWHSWCPEVGLNDPPLAITDLTIELAASDVLLWWTEPSGAIKVTHYLVCRSTAAGSSGDSLAITVDTTYLDVGVAGVEGINYYYTVKAIDALGRMSGESNRVGEFNRDLVNYK